MAAQYLSDIFIYLWPQQFYWADPRSALCRIGTVCLYGSRVGRGLGVVNSIADCATGRKDRECEALEVREVGYMRQDAFRIMPGSADEVGFVRERKRPDPDAGGGGVGRARRP